MNKTLSNLAETMLPELIKQMPVVIVLVIILMHQQQQINMLLDKCILVIQTVPH